MRLGRLPLGIAVLCVTWGAREAQARRAGITESSCSGCHGTRAAELEVLFDPPVTDAGQETTVTVKVRGDSLAVAGMAVSLPEGGQYSIPEDEPLAVSGAWVIHTQPKPAVDAEVTFRFDWRAPSDVGSGAYTAAVLAANDNRIQTGDATASASGRIAYGCEAVTLYRDTDGDGVGVTSQFLTDCVGLKGFVPASGDCDDGDATKYPAAPESCNELDDDCDEEIDENVVDQTYYLDEDADGYGYAEDSQLSCSPVPGYVTNALDCNWTSSAIHPGATEVCDLVDNDCDAEIDEGFEVYCGSGECRRRAANCLIACVSGMPSAELCNGKDDDCDEQVDEEGCDGSEPAPSNTADPAPSAAVSPPTTKPVPAVDAGPGSLPATTTQGPNTEADVPGMPDGPHAVEAGPSHPALEPASPSAATRNADAQQRSLDKGCGITAPPGRPWHTCAELPFVLVGLALLGVRRTRQTR